MKTPNTPEEEDAKADETKEVFEAYADAVKKGDVKENAATMLNAWAHVANSQSDEPSPWLDAMREAHHCEAIFDWAGAEAAYKRAASVKDEKGHPKPWHAHGAYKTLVSFYRLLDRDSLAFETAQASTQAARETGVESLLSFALQAEANFHLKANDLASARKLVQEASDITGNDPLYKLQRIYISILRTDCLVAEGSFTQAESELTGTWELIEPWGDTFFAAGWQGCFASWWTTKAHLRTKQGDLSSAVAAWREVVHRRRIIAQLPQLEGPYKHNNLAVALRNLGRAQRETNDPLAAESFKESRSIRKTIGLPPLDE